MKKIFYLFVLLFTLLSCTGVIDKKIVFTEYNEVMEKVKATYPEYTEKDYTKANKLLDKLVFAALSEGKGFHSDKTYRQLLDEAKSINEKEEQEEKAYFDELNKLRAVLSVHVVQAEYLELPNQYTGELYRTFLTEADYINQSDKLITAFEGVLLVKNNVGAVLKKCLIKKVASNLLPAGKTQRNTEEHPVLSEFDNTLELKALPADKLEYEWIPALIIFSDGSRMVEPKKPAHLYDD